MAKDNAKSHLAAVFRWSAAAETDWVAILASALGMAAPILLGAASGRLGSAWAWRSAACCSAARRPGDARAQAVALISALVPAGAAAILAIALAGHGWVSDAVVVVLAGAAGPVAAMGRRSRPWRSASSCC